MKRIVTRDVYLPEYGLTLGLSRIPGQRWTLAVTGDMPGNLRARMKRKPRRSSPVRAYARDTRP